MSQYVSVIGQTIAVYLLLVVSLRLSGRRELTQLSVLDLVFILLISNALQNAMVGSLHDFIGGLLAAAALFVVNIILKKILFRHGKLQKLVEGESITLIYKGTLQYKNLEKAQITEPELEAAAREHGVDSIKKVDLAVLETDGNVSIMSHKFTHKSSHKRRKHKPLIKST
ncbi:DUF421 domain-containing protein [Salmonirosea aquatica]|uniref:DUF421 domain-containing protein n=1 Tax=Salmonirosea aquatica TaxID=2654236 RepID=A0A7C9F6V8_9BACT|nr:DUF421 domain-containing protein [Cytophagaceae bacterium SJW1-29]